MSRIKRKDVIGIVFISLGAWNLIDRYSEIGIVAGLVLVVGGAVLTLVSEREAERVAKELLDRVLDSKVQL